MRLKKLRFSSSSDPAISVAATPYSPDLSFPPPVQASRATEDWENAMVESQGLAKRLKVHPH